MKVFFRNNKKKLLKLLAVIAIVMIAATIWYEVPVTEHITISGEGKIGSPVRFALVTDLHSCYYGKDQSQLIKMIDKEKPDAILMSGDIFDDRLGQKNARIFIEGVADRYPCFYVTGNHEFWSKKEDEMKEFLTSKGVTVLEGNARNISINGNDIDICGVDDPTYMTESEWEERLDRADKVSNFGNYRILLSHRPEKVEVYKKYDFDLILCGHAHGGQWRIPFTKRGVAAPNQGLLPSYVDGLYDLDNGSKMIVSRGLARERMPYPRFFNHPEVVIIEME
ncbi:metallophosphoesterase [Pseudobutyrivibrio sp.]|uniref:metallophosphoesterase n=1 Tax=Pseudobutyrivibrio sp. TaxID=2014367 RepID=UPI0025F632DF|nr:metallophosphoesterase [Pseudobutyrivibrio sp.]